MKIRVIGNSCSGKTTLTSSLSEHFALNKLHLDGIAFIPESDFVRRDDNEMRSDINQFLVGANDWIIEGNYLSVLSEVFIVPDLIIFIDLEVEQSLENYYNRFNEFAGISRPELPNLIETDQAEMIEWINEYPSRRDKYVNYITNEQLANPHLNILHIEDMGEVIALANNPSLISGFYQ